MQNFSSWLLEELDQRDMSQSDLARSAGLHRAVIYKVISDASKPTPKTLNAIAHALRIPPEIVFEKAGLLTPSSELSATERTLINLAKGLPNDDLEMIFALLKQRHDYYKNNCKGREEKDKRHA